MNTPKTTPKQWTYVIIADDDEVAKTLAEEIKGRGHTVRTAKMVQPESNNGIIFVKRTDVYPNEAWTLARFCDRADLVFVIVLWTASTEVALLHLKFLMDRGTEVVSIMGGKGESVVATALAVVPAHTENLTAVVPTAEGRHESEADNPQDESFAGGTPGNPFGKAGGSLTVPDAGAKILVEPIDDACGTTHRSPAGTSRLDLTA